MGPVSQPFGLLTGTLIALSIFWTYGKVYFYRDPGSLLFFDPSRAYERKYSDLRLSEVLSYRRDVIKKFRSGRTENIPTASKDPEVCAVIVSVDRKVEGLNVHPLEVSLFSAVANLTPSERRSLHIQVYLAHTDPSAHSLWNSPILNVSNNIVDGVSTPLSLDKNSKNLDRLKNYEKDRNLNAKTVLDFTFALQSCLDATKHPKYIALIEDDVIFAEGWYARALQGLAKIESKHAGARTKWLDLRLFRPESNTGWADRRFLGNHVPEIIFIVNVVIATAFLSLRYARIRYGVKLGRPTMLSNANLVVLCVFIIPATVITFFATGKSSLASFYKTSGVHSQNWGCCTQTIFFPSQNIPPLIRDLQDRSEEYTPDGLIMQHAKRESLTRYVLDPVLVQHRGAMDSVITPERNGQAAKGLLWSVSFEDLDPRRLKKEHLEAVKKLFPDDLEHPGDNNTGNPKFGQKTESNRMSSYFKTSEIPLRYPPHRRQSYQPKHQQND